MTIYSAEYISASHHYRRGQPRDVQRFAEGNWLSNEPARIWVEGFAFSSSWILAIFTGMVTRHVVHFLEKVLSIFPCSVLAAATAEANIFHRLSFACGWFASLHSVRTYYSVWQAKWARKGSISVWSHTKTYGQDSRLGNFTTC